MVAQKPQPSTAARSAAPRENVEPAQDDSHTICLKAAQTQASLGLMKHQLFQQELPLERKNARDDLPGPSEDTTMAERGEGEGLNAFEVASSEDEDLAAGHAKIPVEKAVDGAPTQDEQMPVEEPVDGSPVQDEQMPVEEAVGGAPAATGEDAVEAASASTDGFPFLTRAQQFENQAEEKKNDEAGKRRGPKKKKNANGEPEAAAVGEGPLCAPKGAKSQPKAKAQSNPQGEGKGQIAASEAQDQGEGCCQQAQGAG